MSDQWVGTKVISELKKTKNMLFWLWNLCDLLQYDQPAGWNDVLAAVKHVKQVKSNFMCWISKAVWSQVIKLAFSQMQVAFSELPTVHFSPHLITSRLSEYHLYTIYEAKQMVSLLMSLHWLSHSILHAVLCIYVLNLLLYSTWIFGSPAPVIALLYAVLSL